MKKMKTIRKSIQLNWDYDQRRTRHRAAGT